MHAASVVTYSGDGDPPAQQYALVLHGHPADQGELKLLVWQGVDGWQEHGAVPHGSAAQGDTWH